MSGIKLHPTARLMVLLLLMFGIQGVSGGWLAACFLLIPFFGRAVLRRGGQLIGRTRWLFLPLFAVFAWGVAGEPLWNGFASPSLEGLLQACDHIGRLLLVLFLVAAFLESMPLADLLVASHCVLAPFRRFGLEPERGAVRLMLVLRYVEEQTPVRDWRSLLRSPEVCSSEVLEIDSSPLGLMDWFAMLALATLVVLVFCY